MVKFKSNRLKASSVLNIRSKLAAKKGFSNHSVTTKMPKIKFAGKDQGSLEPIKPMKAKGYNKVLPQQKYQ